LILGFKNSRTSKKLQNFRPKNTRKRYYPKNEQIAEEAMQRRHPGREKLEKKTDENTADAQILPQITPIIPKPTPTLSTADLEKMDRGIMRVFANHGDPIQQWQANKGAVSTTFTPELEKLHEENVKPDYDAKVFNRKNFFLRLKSMIGAKSMKKTLLFDRKNF